MIGYFDPDTLKVEENRGSISFVNAADGDDVQEVEIASTNDAKTILAALNDQMTFGIAGRHGSFRKVQGTFTRNPGSKNEGIILDPDTGNEIPVRMAFDVKPNDLPGRGICIAVGEMIEGALMVERITVAPIAPMPVPQQGIQTPQN
jgi:hypothetical protein